MKKFYILFLACLSMTAFQASANEGDTTVVLAHDNTELSWYNNYDAVATFPDGNLSYRKILMEFELGKYQCEGYNPSNAGEGPNQTGWCADWDYDVHVIACTPGGDTLELGELITPYANSNFPRTPWSWRHSYWFDVTDFYSILKNDVTIRIFYSGYSGGFTGTVKFHFVEGTRARDVVGISKLWHGGFAYGDSTNPIDNNITPISETMPANAVSAVMRLIISGHGGDTPENCSEFCKKWYQFKINGNNIHQQDIWRDNCGNNFLYPQSGTWVYDRANWCPGDQVFPFIEKVPESITPGQTFTVDMDFQNYSSNGGASYKVAAAMLYYGPFNHDVDASLEAIISPNDNETYYRENPICGGPVVKVKNEGGNTITSIKFSYGIVGQTPMEYTWNGSLAPVEEAEITLAPLPALQAITGSSNEFTVSIEEVNGQVDEDQFNNTMRTVFTAAPQWEGGFYRLEMKMSSAIQGFTNKVNWTVKTLDGTTLYSRNGIDTSTSQNPVIYTDTLELPNGCYRLDVDANYIGYGLSFFNAFSIPGYIKAYNLNTGTQYPLPKTDLVNPGLSGNFGTGFTQFFTVNNSTGIKNPENQYSLSIYPNPAQDKLNVDIIGMLNEPLTITMVNVLGQTVYATTTTKNQVHINTSDIAQGLYTLICTSGNQKKIEKVVITH
jgi:hypothetical protein